MVRWGILGAGNIAHRFAKSLKNEEDSQLYAIALRSEEKAKTFIAQNPCEKYYLDYQQLIDDENVDAIYLSLPHGLHKEWAIKALNNHKAVLCEKPAVINAQEMREIASVARKNNVLFMEAMKPRFVPMYSYIKKIINEGVIGNINRIETEICFQIVDSNNSNTLTGKTYHTQKGQGGCLLDSGTYCASWIVDYLSEPIKVTNTDMILMDDIDVYVQSFLSDEKIEARLEVGFDRNKARDAFITGTAGSIHVFNLHRPEKIEIIKDNKSEIVCVPYENDDFYGEIHHFVQLINSNKTESDIMSLNDSIMCATLLDSIRNSFNR